MADTTANEAKISIKVIVDKVNKRVVCAEADHSFVDILFSFITLPMGTIIRLLGKLDDKSFERKGSLNNLYQSLKDFPDSCLSNEECKPTLLNPRSLSYDYCRHLKLKLDDTKPIQYFICNHINIGTFTLCNSISSKDTLSKNCQRCGSLMDLKESYWYSNVCANGGVFVSDNATFIITDDLRVEPYSSGRSLRLLTDLGITDMNHLEERNLEMSTYQMLNFLKLALSVDFPFTYIIFSKTIFIRDIGGSWEKNAVDRCDLMKKEVSASSKMLIEVSLQKSTGMLLFAEAKEDFVEFLFGTLSIPLGTIIGTVNKVAISIRCMHNIFESISKMSVGSRYLKSQYIKDMLLKPHIGQQCSSKYQLIPLEGVPTRLTSDPGTDKEFLKPYGMFLVTDDLTITPSSLIATADILKKLKVSPEDVERREISIGLKEGLSILKASQSYFWTLTKSLEHQLKK